MSVGGRTEVTSGHLEARGEAPVGGPRHELEPGVVGAGVHHPRGEVLVRGVGRAPRGQAAIEGPVGPRTGVVHQLRGVRGLVAQATVPQLCVLQEEDVVKVLKYRSGLTDFFSAK